MPDDQIQRELEFKQCSLDNLERFSELFEKCFDTPVGPRYFNWKYRENPTGDLVAFEAVHKGKSIASYGVIPETYLVHGNPMRVWQSMDTMTHPDYQRRGLFITLAKKTFSHLATIDPTFVIVGIPGPASYPGFVNKLGWKDIHSYRMIFLHQSMHAVTKRLRTPPRLTFRRVREMLPDVRDYLQKRPRSPRALTNHFTPEFFDWRVFRNPMKRFTVLMVCENDQPIGMCVYTVDERHWALINFLDFHREGDFARCTPAVAAHLFAHANPTRIYTWEPMNPVVAHGFARAGFVANPFSKGPMTYKQPLIIHSATGTLGGVDVFNPKNYDLQPLMQD